jgi:hypothetical protein
MGVLDRFEKRLEGLVSGAFARAFKAEVQPVEIASAVQREMDNHAAIVGPGRTFVPNDFVVELGTGDHERLTVYAEALGNELAAMAREHAAEQGFTLIGPVRVTFEHDESLETGVFRVRGTAVSGRLPGPRGPAGLGGTARLEGQGATFLLSPPVAVIGRGTEADVRLEDPGVSRRHAEIRLSADGARIVDLGSTNGTSVNGHQVSESELADGSEVTIGRTRLVFHRDAGGGE